LKLFSTRGTRSLSLRNFKMPRGRLGEYSTEDRNSARNTMVRQIGASPGDSGWGKYAVIANPMSRATSAHGSLLKFLETFVRMDRTMPPTPEERRVSPASPDGDVVLATRATTVRPCLLAPPTRVRREAASVGTARAVMPDVLWAACLAPVDDDDRAEVTARAGAATFTAATRKDAPIASIFALCVCGSRVSPWTGDASAGACCATGAVATGDRSFCGPLKPSADKRGCRAELFLWKVVWYGLFTVGSRYE